MYSILTQTIVLFIIDLESFFYYQNYRALSGFRLYLDNIPYNFYFRGGEKWRFAELFVQFTPPP